MDHTVPRQLGGNLEAGNFSCIFGRNISYRAQKAAFALTDNGLTAGGRITAERPEFFFIAYIILVVWVTVASPNKRFS
jgi:hypothetical protein